MEKEKFSIKKFLVAILRLIGIYVLVTLLSSAVATVIEAICDNLYSKRLEEAKRAREQAEEESTSTTANP